MYVVLGASGNTGHVVAQRLLAKGKKVRVVARNPAHLKFLESKGGEIFVADLTDTSVLTKAFQGADSAYVMIPPDTKSNDVRAFQEKISDTISQSAQSAGLKHIVSLSSIGADKS